MKRAEIMREMTNPGTEYRSLPFYSLNGRLNKDEVARQTGDLIAHGMGGFFLHSREGLETEYMSDEWMEAIESAGDAAEKAGGHAWLYDEDRFPSGGAGGRVAGQNRARYAAKAITMSMEEEEEDRDILAVFACRLDSERLLGVRRLRNLCDSLERGENRVVFRIETSKPCEWYNGEPPTDNMDPETVKQFLRLTHEEYKKRFGDRFGKQIQGIFTDEPNINDFRSSYTEGRSYLPWSFEFEKDFAARRGYDLCEELPYLFFEGDKSFKIRHDFWRTVSERFVNAYSKTMYDWCEENGLKYTGHYMREDSLGASVRMSGTIMPHYLYEHIPGIDMLTGDARELMTVKQVSSVTNQLGRRCICEMYGCSGWDYTFEGQKKTGDWLFAMGVDIRCQHHSMYTIKGCAKRDYPPTFNYNSVWWKYNRITEDYFARIAAAMSLGQAVRPALIIHPQSSAWGTTGAAYCKDYEWHCDDSKADDIQKRLEKLMETLSERHIDFDFGDEFVMEKTGTVRNDKIVVGQMEYGIVVIPELVTLTESTYRLLMKYAENGGKLFLMGDKLKRIDGLQDDRIRRLTDRCECHGDEKALTDAIDRQLGDRVHICDDRQREAGGIMLYQKRHEDCIALFTVNTDDRETETTLEVPPECCGKIEEVSLLTGKTILVGIEVNEKGIQISREYRPHESALFLIDLTTKAETAGKLMRQKPDPASIYRLPLSVSFERTHPNALLLDKASWSYDGSAMAGEDYVYAIQQKVRKTAGMRDIYANGSQQRYLWVNRPHPSDGKTLVMQYRFFVDAVPEKTVYLACETPERFAVDLNGQSVSNEICGWYTDRCVGTVMLPQLKRGENILTMRIDYRDSDQLEDVFLIGDFGVSPDRVIVREPVRLRVGDWGMQGYFHYAGGIRYIYRLDGKPFGKNKLYIGGYRGVTAHIEVNGKEYDIPWHCADGIDISDALHEKGENRIIVEIMGSQRNLMGLFHKNGSQNEWVDWTFFSREDSRTYPEYDTVSYGLMQAPYLTDACKS